jgi:glycosyltransferase involved in cell wall biosynthesis
LGNVLLIRTKNLYISINLIKDLVKRYLTLTVGMVTCWYKDVSMANYAYNLISGLDKNPFIEVKIVSSACLCAYNKFAGSRVNFRDENCRFVSFPPYIYIRPKRIIGKILNELVQNFLHFLRGIAYLSKCKSCEIVHYQQSAFSLGILPLIPIMLIPTSNKKIVTIHSLTKTVGARILKITYNRADKVIVHSKEMMKTLVSFGVNPSKIEVIRHGARIPKLMSCKRDKVTFFGSLVKEKGAFVLLDALKILKEKGEKELIYFYGIYSVSEKASFNTRAIELNVNDCVIWGGRLTEDEFDKKMQESMFTFAIYTAPVSGSSIITRAIANGAPVIATNIGGTSEYSQSLMLVPPNDSNAVAKAILKLSRNATLRKKLSEAARKDALKISWDIVAEKNLDVYLDTLRPQKNS